MISGVGWPRVVSVGWYIKVLVCRLSHVPLTPLTRNVAPDRSFSPHMQRV
jgi:hypothetical protein